MNLASCCKYPYSSIILLHSSLIASLFLLLIAGCGEDDGKAVEVVEILPQPGTWIYPQEQFTIRFNVPIIPSSGSITFGGFTYKLPDSDVSDTITWNRCWRVINDNPAPLMVHDFQDVDGRIQAKAFQASYPAYIVDPDSPTVIDHQPSGSRVDPAITREIRFTFSRPMAQVEFTITPAIDGFRHVANKDVTECTGIVRWVFADTAELSYATEYHVQLLARDRIQSSEVYIGISFTTLAEP